MTRTIFDALADVEKKEFAIAGGVVTDAA